MNHIPPEEPDPHAPTGLDPTFRVIVPVTGGLGSTTVLLLAYRAGLPTQPLYVDTGLPAAADEIATARALLEHLHGPALLVRDHPAAGYQGIIEEAAQLTIDRGWWGELWLGHTDEPGVTPVTGPELSHRWMTQIQHLLTSNNIDLRVAQPLAGWTRQDTVAWWDRLIPGGAQTAADWTTDCHDGPCGGCRACLHRWAAFHDSTGTLRWPAGHDLRSVIETVTAEEHTNLDACTQVGGQSVLWAAPRVTEWHQTLDRYRPQPAP